MRLFFFITTVFWSVFTSSFLFADTKEQDTRILMSVLHIDKIITSIPDYLKLTPTEENNPLTGFYAKLSKNLEDTYQNFEHHDFAKNFFISRANPEIKTSLITVLSNSLSIDMLSYESKTFDASNEEIQRYLMSIASNESIQALKPTYKNITTLRQPHYSQIQYIDNWIGYLLYAFDQSAGFDPGFNVAEFKQRLQDSFQPYLIVFSEQEIHKAAYTYRSAPTEDLRAYSVLVGTHEYQQLILLRDQFVAAYLDALFAAAKINSDSLAVPL